MKTCTKCGENKPLSEYHRSKQHQQGVRSDCKECVRKRVADRWAFYKYGLETADLNALLQAQNYQCAGCGCDAGSDGASPRERWSDVGLCIDHCHTTGKVRGLLCHGCNTTLGLANDRPETLRRLADYLDRNKI